MKKIYSVAVDGPSGAGKSTLAKAIARELGIVYVDTGAMYRSIGLHIREKGIDPLDAAAVIAALPEIHIDMDYSDDGTQHMYLGGRDVSAEIRLPEISMYASHVSAIPQVRAFLMEMQRAIAREKSVIMDGRDIGTVVLPDADVGAGTVLTCEQARNRAIAIVAAARNGADPAAERDSGRRAITVKELAERGTPKPYEEVLQEMEQRDYQDSHREAAPLRPADDAIMVDTSDLDFAGSRDLLLDVIKGSVGL